MRKQTTLSLWLMASGILGTTVAGLAQAEIKVGGNDVSSLTVNGVALNQTYTDNNVEPTYASAHSLKGVCTQYLYQEKSRLALTKEEERQFSDLYSEMEKLADEHSIKKYTYNDGQRDKAFILTIGKANKVISVGFRKVYDRPYENIYPAVTQQFNFTESDFQRPKKFDQNFAGNPSWIPHKKGSTEISAYHSALAVNPGDFYSVFEPSYQQILAGEATYMPSEYTMVHISQAGGNKTEVVMDNVGLITPALNEAKQYLDTCVAKTGQLTSLVKKRLNSAPTL